MTVNNGRGVVRNVNRVVSRLRVRVSSALIRGQLGPGTESAVELADNSMWSRHRPL